jgi:hypothetical protein
MGTIQVRWRFFCEQIEASVVVRCQEALILAAVGIIESVGRILAEAVGGAHGHARWSIPTRSSARTSPARYNRASGILRASTTNAKAGEERRLA